MTDVSIRTMLLEFVDSNGASHIRETAHRDTTPQAWTRRSTRFGHVCLRLSLMVCWIRLGMVSTTSIAEDEGMTSVVSYPNRMVLWGSSGYRGNCGRPADQGPHHAYGARKRGRPDGRLGTSRDVVEGLNRYKHVGIPVLGRGLRRGFDLTQPRPARQVRFRLDSPTVLEHRGVPERSKTT